jgi:hypothetical protein
VSIEHEISGAEGEAMEAAFECISRQVPDLVFPGGKAEEDALYEGVWLACREYVGMGELQEIAIKRTVEQRQRADMAEEREKKLREILTEISDGFSWDNREEGCLAASQMQEAAKGALENA